MVTYRNSSLYSIDNFKNKIAETTYSNIFRDVIELILEGTNIKVDDGETVSELCKKMSILGKQDSIEFGQRIDLSIHEALCGHEVELCGIESKVQNAD